jgi:thiol-disulfide isomerase/thioredoxin
MYPHDPKPMAFLLCVLMFAALPVTAKASLKVGDTLPPLKSFKLEGTVPDQLKGQVILLDFWASWCGPCKQSFPAMEELQKRYAEKGLCIVAVSVDEKREDMERFLKSAKVSFATPRDAGQKLVAAADVATMPTSFLVDRQGKIRFIHNGFRGDETIKEYRQQIEALLKEPAP